MNNQNFKLFYLITPITMVVLLATLLFLSLTSCYVPYHPPDPYKPRSQNGPTIEAAKASCYHNYTYDDYMWYFDAWINYPQPHHDYEEIVDVYVEVYDGPYLIDSFPLYHEREKFWTSSWIERIETDLWCGDYYEVDFVAFDYHGNYDVLTTHPYY
jgi:hypothetical protein